MSRTNCLLWVGVWRQIGDSALQFQVLDQKQRPPWTSSFLVSADSEDKNDFEALVYIHLTLDSVVLGFDLKPLHLVFMILTDLTTR